MKKKLEVIIASFFAIFCFTIIISSAVVTSESTVKVPSWGAGTQLPGTLRKDTATDYGYASVSTGSSLSLGGRFFAYGGDITGYDYTLVKGKANSPYIRAGTQCIGWNFNFKVYSNNLEPNSNNATVKWSPL